MRKVLLSQSLMTGSSRKMPTSASVAKVTLKLWMSWNSTKLTLTLVKGRAQTRKLASSKTNGTAVTVGRNVVITEPAGNTTEQSIWAYLSTTVLWQGVGKAMIRKIPSSPTS